jgi:hypothetical protein
VKYVWKRGEGQRGFRSIRRQRTYDESCFHIEDRGYRTPCWVWDGSIDRQGYGMITRRDGRRVLAHRHFYAMYRGDIPCDRELDHLCRVHNCVNPDHLDPVSHAVNTQRALGKLSPQDRSTIRKECGVYTFGIYRRLARKYGVTSQTIKNIVDGKVYKNEG